jgi:GR25 family glycosyltransferase involved in LPS biosynthesis
VKSIKNNHEYVLILEDDIILDDNFNELFDKYYKQVPDDWDMIHLGSSWLKGKKISENILKTNHTTGAYAILFKLNTLKEIIEKKLPIHTSIDLEIGSFITENKKNSYAFYPPLIKHNNNIVSDRQSMDSNKKIFHDKSQEQIILL